MSLHRFPELNQVACSGRLTRDPETRITQTGKLRVTFDVAVNLSYRDKNDDWKQETSFIPVVSWDKLAEAIAKNLHKGSGVFLTGRLHSRKLEGAHGNRSMIEVVARTVQFLDRKKEQDSQTTPPPFNGQEEKDDAPAF